MNYCIVVVYYLDGRVKRMNVKRTQLHMVCEALEHDPTVYRTEVETEDV